MSEKHRPDINDSYSNRNISWYDACDTVAGEILETIPEHYRRRTFSGILGDIKALSSKKALSLISRKKGLGRQYAWLYLTQGIDQGHGYQACASESLQFILNDKNVSHRWGRVLDVGCAVGVTAGVLSLDSIVGFDLFPDLLHAAKSCDAITGGKHAYVAADMIHVWPFVNAFDTVVCGLVCHHLKQQSELVHFFSESNRVLSDDGTLIVTLPSGSISTGTQFSEITTAIESFGFEIDNDLSGMVLSDDSDHSLFWMFLIVAKKKSSDTGNFFIDPEFGFHQYRTPVTRVEKGDKARETVKNSRRVKHDSFIFIGMGKIIRDCAEKILVYETVQKLLLKYF